MTEKLPLSVELSNAALKTTSTKQIEQLRARLGEIESPIQRDITRLNLAIAQRGLIQERRTLESFVRGLSGGIGV